MGYKNTSYKKSLHQQAYQKLTSMQAFGESKKTAIKNGTAKDKIFSFNTYDTYWKHTKYFIKYVNRYHPECKSLKKAKAYVNEWLRYRTEYVNDKGEHLSAWTIQTEAMALYKLYGIEVDDPEYVDAPERKRADIKRSRLSCERDKDFSVTNNDTFIKFCRATGLRRRGIEETKGKDLVEYTRVAKEVVRLLGKQNDTELSKREKNILSMCKDALNFTDVSHFVYVKEKGGRERLAPIVGPNAQLVIDRYKNTGKDEKVWLHVPSHADIHSYRGDYATAIYKLYARPIDDIPYDKFHPGLGRPYQSQVYCCRKDEKGKKLDKLAMLLASKALGHNRIEIVANNYLRGI